MEGKLDVKDMGFQNQEAYLNQEQKYLIIFIVESQEIRKKKLLILEEGISGTKFNQHKQKIKKEKIR